MDKDKEENESSGVYLYGPDVYVLSNRQNPKGAFLMPQEYGEANHTDAPAPEAEEIKDKVPSDVPVCPQCGNVIIGDPKFCCECGFKLKTRQE